LGRVLEGSIYGTDYSNCLRPFDISL